MRSSKSRGLGVIVALLMAVLVASNVVLWIALLRTRDDLGEAQDQSELAVTGLADASDRLDTIETSLGDFDSGTEDVSARVDDLESSVDDLQSCVNAYFRAASRGGSFTFRFC
jgi:hypothetical protein